ncbi:acyl-CoA dehydrogenase family protein [Saccharopolyspora spinosa]|uniref:Alkylation response protein AidB-like acyl-CoA dehydrogenase n=1 Tax=Saccharopolyspora spinosa TaxID=60894 RepID=A0A2N3Y046_SACSN|nr:acyl-CoA dehydrogenase family protein [Saccharopolyspora spinosa]PKW16288.1 alkylation response protein AidB-like acyl-CoA dehydrogenase [Saccharopolyspora spinosa]
MEFVAVDDKIQQLRERTRSVAEAEVQTNVVTRDRNASWDQTLFTRLAEMGIVGALLPTAHNGLGATVLEAVAMLEGFGEGSGDAGLSLALGTHGVLCAVPIAKLGSFAQREHYLPRMASGEWLGGLALSEVDGCATETGPGITAVQQREGWLLGGRKPHVVNAPHAHHFVVTAVTATGERSAFLIDRNTPGLAVMPNAEPTAMRTCPSADLVLEDCQVPADAVLGRPGAATDELVPLLAALDRTCLLAPWLGIIREITRQTVALVTDQPFHQESLSSNGDGSPILPGQRSRGTHVPNPRSTLPTGPVAASEVTRPTLFGAPLVRSQAIRAAIVDMRTKVELGSDLLYRAAGQLDRPEPAPRQDAAAAKLFITRAAQDIARTAAGIAGLTPHHLAERAQRDSLLLAATGGGQEILRSVVAGALLGLG